MSREKVLLLLILLPFVVLSQSLEKDTITLTEVVIQGSKSPKLKTIKFGRGIGSASPSFVQNPEVAFLIEDIPRGELKELTIYFDAYRKIWNDNGGRIRVGRSEFEITLYDIDENNKIGKKLHERPILVTLEESEKCYLKKVLDLSKFSIYTNRFFVVIKRIFDIPCNECFIYLPATSLSNKKMWFHGNLNTIEIDEDLQKEDSTTLHWQLRSEVKVLTRNY